MQIRLVIVAELEREHGKFISKDDLAESIRGELEGADPGAVDIDDSSYAVTSWDVTVEELPKGKKG